MIVTRIYTPITRVLAFLLLAASVAGTPALAQDVATTVPQTWQMLDYLATDYAGAVQDGKVVSTSEYAEMREFSATAAKRIASLPAGPATAALNRDADALVAAVDAKAAPEAIAAQAHALAAGLLKAYPVPTAPEHTPDLARGAALYQSTCAACHGATGRGDGPAGKALDPPPIAFTDQARADQRSALSLFEVISQGVEGTSMASYAKQLSREERWDLAYYVGTLAYTKEQATGAQAWQHDDAARAQVADLKELSQARVTQLAPALGTDTARAIVGYLRAHPDAMQQALSGVPLARGRVAASLAAYRAGNAGEATALALSAYLDGIEPVEPQLNGRDAALRSRIETAMGAYRTALARHAPATEITNQAKTIDVLLAQAQDVLSESNDPAATFLGAFTILVREGLEALLVVVALLAFLRKAERVRAIRYVHAGWVLALVAGGITWAIARYFITISGAGRELTEGLSSLFAALVLLSVGLWMHQKSIGGRWQAYLKTKMTAAVEHGSAWFLFGLAFISVYREVFETILFYAALWNEGQEIWIVAGILGGAVVLALIAWTLLRTSRRLPIGTFFSASSFLIAILAFVLTGKGVAALQEAGWLGVTVAPVPRIELLGIFPTWQSVSAQLAILVLLVAGFTFNTLHGRKAAVAAHA
ncbi:MAG TPA: cytochrome c/FTR1 family iron permease [Rhodanobacter sp.]|nr:cytochrome c/FTR1 family iron permease [Rhodanobacter sp.]